MYVWIALGLVGFGLVLLVLAVLAVLRRLGVLRRAMVRAQRRSAQARELQGSVEALQVRLAEVAVRAAAVRPGRKTASRSGGAAATFVSGE